MAVMANPVCSECGRDTTPRRIPDEEITRVCKAAAEELAEIANAGKGGARSLKLDFQIAAMEWQNALQKAHQGQAG